MTTSQDLAPTHLAGFATPSPSGDSRASRSFELRSSEGGDWFEVRFHGELLEDERLVVGDDLPALVVAHAVDTGEQVVLFDGGRHGYDAMFVEEHDTDDLDTREPTEAFTSPDGTTHFRLRVELFDNIDWDDEQDEVTDDDGRIVLLDGTVIDDLRLRADGFDAIGVIAIDEAGDEHPVVEESLA